MRRHVRLLAVLATSILLATLTGCGDDDGEVSPPDPEDRLVAIYAATIEALAADAGPLPGEDDNRLTIFVAPREDATIDADVQVGVVSELESWASVRFIDGLDEAIERDDPEEPVRDDGLLIGLGAVSDGEAAATLVADRYESVDSMTVFEVDVVRRVGEWNVETPLDGVPVDAP